MSPIGVELLDDPAADPEAVRLSLTNIARANRWFGAWPAVRSGLVRLLRGNRVTDLSLLDVGTGAGDLPVLAERWARGQGLRLRALGLDQHGAAAHLARHRGIPAVVGCGAHLPFPDRSVDLVTLSQVAHHLSAESLGIMVRELSRVARLGVVLADLRPSRIAQAAYRLTGPLLGFDHYTVVDGITSLERGYTRVRLTRELRAAGIDPWVRTSLGVRIVAVWRMDGLPA
jgi:hypothetical protein